METSVRTSANSSNSTRTHTLALCFGACLLGVAPITVKLLPFPPEVSAFYRVLLAIPFIAAVAFFRPTRTSQPSKDRNLYPLLIAATVFFSADLVCMHIAIRITDVAVATLLTNCAPLFVALYGLAGLGDKPSKSDLACLPFAILGISLLCGAKQAEHSMGFPSLLALLSAAFYGAYILTIKEIRTFDVSPARIMLPVTAGSAVLLTPLFLHANAPPLEGGRTWILILALVLFGQVFGQLLVTTALRHLTAASGSLALLIQPIVSAMASLLLLKETLSPLELVGAIVVLVSIFIGSYLSKR